MRLKSRSMIDCPEIKSVEMELIGKLVQSRPSGPALPAMPGRAASCVTVRAPVLFSRPNIRTV